MVTSLRLSNKQVDELFAQNKIFVNGKLPHPKQKVNHEDEIVVNEEVIKESKPLLYFKYYKPRGVECTMNENIPNNLKSTLNFDFEIFPIGRLDKESEGLMILTNDGKIYNKIIHSNEHQEKEYFVEVDSVITDEFILQMQQGVVIMGEKTRPCTLSIINEYTFSIVLTQGLNRQIRRMCYKLGYNVLNLKRIRMININLEGLKEGEVCQISRSEINI